jgi:hypothetical protein
VKVGMADAKRRIVIPEDASLKDIWQDVPAKLLWKVGRLLIYVALAAFSFGSFLGPWWTSNTVKEAGKTPNSGAVSVSSFNPDANSSPSAIQSLRERNKVSPISPMQNQLSVDRLPDGVYGYVSGYSIQIAVTRKERFSALTNAHPNWFEFHKLTSGLVIVGYVNTTDVNSLDDPRRSRTQFEIFSMPMPSMVPAMIRFDKLRKFETRDLADRGSIAEIELEM